MVTVLRIGHRVKRDKRITSHVALVARAFGASCIIMAGEKDPTLVCTVEKVMAEWGGVFEIKMIPEEDWEVFVKQWKKMGKSIIHLSMYGKNLYDFERTVSFKRLKNQSDELSNLLVIVGGKKVPGKVFHLADWNIAIGNQPHSEVSSLAVFLDHLMPNILQKKFEKAEKRIIPSVNGFKKYKKENNYEF